jgi:undecaprenyl-diphosphatase
MNALFHVLFLRCQAGRILVKYQILEGTRAADKGERATMERLEAYDLGMLYWFLRWRSPWLNEALLTWTHLGDFAVLVCVVVVGAGVLLLCRRPRLALVLVFVASLGWCVEWGLKLSIDRPRPHVAAALTEPPANPSFPSGHALGTMAVYGSLGLLLGRVRPRWLAPLVAAAVLLSLTVGLTRVMIGVHYPFDVLAGWLAGVLCVLTASLLTAPPVDPAPVPAESALSDR